MVFLLGSLLEKEQKHCKALEQDVAEMDRQLNTVKEERDSLQSSFQADMTKLKAVHDKVCVRLFGSLHACVFIARIGLRVE